MSTLDRKQIYLREIASQYGRYVPDDVQLVERNGYIFFVHPKLRYDPITLLVIAGVGTAIGVAGKLQEGRQAEKIAERRAEIDIENAEAVRREAVEEAKIKTEKGQRLRATQKSLAAAGGIRINVGVPLVIETQTQADITRDIGFGLERGREESEFYRSRAGLEIAVGKAAKRRSRFQALQLGLQGAIGLSGMFANLPGTTLPPGLPLVGRFKPEVGATLARF